MNYIESQEILNQIYLERYKNGQTQKVQKLLETANEEAKRLLRKTKEIQTKKHYQEVSEKLKAISKELSKKVNKQLDTTELIEEEIERLNKEYTKMYKKLGVKYNFTSPSEKTIRSAVMFKPFADGANYDVFLNSIQEGFYNIWDNSVREGFILGETTQDIIKRVMGTLPTNAKPARYGAIETVRQSIERNTRTWLQSMSTQSRNSFYEENEKVISGYKWVSALDRKTCLICGQLDGKIYKRITDFEQPPLHYNCRCIIVPIVKGFEGFEGTRASEKGYVSEKTTYQKWFNEQSDEIKKDILGETRYRMYKEDKLKIKDFVSDNKVLTINELRKKWN